MPISRFFQRCRFRTNTVLSFLFALWFSANAFSATPNPQRVGEVRGETLLYAGEQEFATLGTIDGVQIVYRYSAGGAALGTFSINTKSVSGRGFSSLVSVGEVLIAQYDLNPLQEALSVSEFSVWSRTGAMLANASIANGASFEGRQFALDGNTLVVRRTNSRQAPLERFDKISLNDGKVSALMIFPTRSSDFALAGGVINVVRDELEVGDAVAYAHSFDLDGKKLASRNIGALLQSPSGGLGVQVLRIGIDPKSQGDLELHLQWDFLRAIVSLDRSTLAVKSQRKSDLRADQFGSEVTRRAGKLVTNFEYVGFRGITIRELIVENQNIEVRGGYGGNVVLAPDESAWQGVRACIETSTVGFNTVCLKIGSPTIYRYDLTGDFTPAMTVTSSDGDVRAFASSADGGARFAYGSGRLKHAITGEVQVPIVFENVGGNATVSTRSSSYLGNDYSAEIANRWTYDATRKLLIAPALPFGTTESVYISVTVNGKRWSFDRLQIQYDASAAESAKTALVEFYNTALGHFFVTLEGAEAKGIDQGAAGPGWMRTGYAWGAWKYAASAPAGALPVCRFYGNPALNNSGKRIGPNSHFYTIDADECARVAKDPGWILETNAAFYARPTDPVDFFCAGDTVGLRRWYNNGYPTKDSNHRFSSQGDMSRTKWTDEGVRFCLANSP